MSFSFSSSRSILALGLVLGGLGAAACVEAETEVESSEAAQTSRDGGREGGDAGEGGSTSTLNPPPGTDGNELDVDLVVNAWNKVKADFYDSAGGYRYPANATAPSAQEPLQCMGNCPSVSYYSDIVCQFYCWHPSYAQVSPNVRGCFSYLARGSAANGQSITRTDPITGQTRPLAMYPEIYDYCLYQEYDAVFNPITGAPGASVPAYNQATIDANKAANNLVGVLKWVHENEEKAFKHVMWTWYNPDAFTMESQQKAINKFYGVTLTKPDYTAADAQDVAACRAKRPMAPHDPRDGTHCSSTKVFSAPRAKHRNMPDIVRYMNTL